jgi:2-iminoacetate synthase ThiH
MKKTDLVQLPYLYALNRSSGTEGKTMPTPLLTVAARLLKAGVALDFFDENIKPYQYQGAEVVLLNLHGSPYIPEIIAFQKKILGEAGAAGHSVKFVLGGEIASRLTKVQFEKLFGAHAVNGNHDELLAEALAIPRENLAPVEEVSLIPMYQQLPEEYLRHYLAHNISLYVSQGCKFSCKFCSARRTRRDPETGLLVRQEEKYKQSALIAEELQYLIGRSKSFGNKKLICYLSNLDLFQTPAALGTFAAGVDAVKKQHPDFTLDIRGLGTIHSFLDTAENYPGVMEALIKAGLKRVAFGVDGITPDVWKKIGKTHNFSGFKEEELDSKAKKAIRVAKELGITTELLMLFGHNGADTEASMAHATEFTREMLREYGAIPRSFVAKDIVPGTEAWYDPKNSRTVDTLIEHPELFQALDYLAIASPLTHPDEEFRKLTNKYFLENATIGKKTKGDKPLYSTQLSPDGNTIERFYGGVYDVLKTLNPVEI